MAIQPGQVIGAYRVVEKIGEGGMGAVYRAEDTAIGRSVVLKVLATDAAGQPDMLQRFHREVEMIASLEHPHILPVYEFGEVEGDPYIAMRFMRGGSLLEKRRRTRDELLRIFDQVAQALDFAHDRDVIHRDLKPGNVLLDEQGNAYLADFGLAKTMEGSRDLTQTGGILGTPAYMSPEQARGEKLDRRSDVYAFAVMAYEALSGKSPFEANTPMEFIFKHLTEPPRAITSASKDLPRALDPVFERGLAKDRAQRPMRATEFMAMLREALEQGALTSAAAWEGAGDRTAPARTRVSPAGAAAVGERVSGGTAAAEAARGAGSGAAVAPEAAVRPAEPRRSVLRWLLRAGAVIVIGGIGIAVVAALAARQALGRPQVSVYPVGDSPRALLPFGDSVWVANGNDDTLARLAASGCAQSNDPCGQALASYSVARLPVALASDGTSLWIASAFSRSLTQMDPQTGEVRAELPLPNVPTAMVYADGSLWTANEFGESLTKLTSSGALVGDFAIGSAPRAMLWDGERLWVASEQDNLIAQVDAETGEVSGRFPIDGGPAALEFAGSALWAALTGTGEVVQLDPANGSVLRRVDLGGRPVALLFEGETLWVADQSGDRVVGVEVATGELSATIAVEGGPFALAQVTCGEGCVDLWVAGEASDTVSRIRLP